MKPQVIRDVLIEEIAGRMESDERIFFLSADFGSPALDRLRADFSDRFLNVGIAEQNLVSVAAGLALEGFTVYAYAIAPFLSMRAFEQIRINLAMMAQQREVNVNLIGVGAGLSYDVTGPTHHCLEDIAIMRVLPNVTMLSPADASLVPEIVSFTLADNKPCYIRLDGKAMPRIYPSDSRPTIQEGACTLRSGAGADVCLVATGYMTHVAMRVAEALEGEGISVGVVDVFMLKESPEGRLRAALDRYSRVVTLEEGFVRRGGLDALVMETVVYSSTPKEIYPLGFQDSYIYEVGDRTYLHRAAGLGEDRIIEFVRSLHR